MSNPPRFLRTPWPLLVILGVVMVTGLVAVGIYFKTENDRIRQELNLEPGESYQDVINKLEKS